MPAYIIWDVNPIAFKIGDIGMTWYGLSWSAAIVITYLFSLYFMKKENYPTEKAIDVVLYALIFGVVGSRITHVLFYDFSYFMENPGQIINAFNGGFASHGGVVGSIIGLYIFHKRNPQFRFLWLLDRISILIPTLAILIRFGNLFNSEIIGKPSSVPWAFIFTSVDNLPRHPSQLYEILMLSVVFPCLFFLYKRIQNRKPGIFVALFLTFAFFFRFLLEFLKESDTCFLGISNTQWLSLPMILTGVVLLFLVKKNRFSLQSEHESEGDI